MSLKLPWRSLLSLAASVLILLVGWQRINGKVREKPSIQEDSILTPDEIANLPTGTLVAVLPQGESSDDPLLRLSAAPAGPGEKWRWPCHRLWQLITDQQASIQRIGASMEPSKPIPPA